MRKAINDIENSQIEKNIMFVSTIYDSFEALEETLDKLELSDARFLVSLGKKYFAKEVIKYAKKTHIYAPIKEQSSSKNITLN